MEDLVDEKWRTLLASGGLCWRVDDDVNERTAEKEEQDDVHLTYADGKNQVSLLRCIPALSLVYLSACFAWEAIRLVPTSRSRS